MKLIVHIGTGKTGTTSVQQAMKINSNLLESQGITYPTTIFDDHNILEAAVLEFDKLHRVYKSKFSRNQNELNELSGGKKLWVVEFCASRGSIAVLIHKNPDIAPRRFSSTQN